MSSTSTEDATNFRRTLALGKELAAGLDQSDILGRWMAHYVSELMVGAEFAPATERNVARQEASRAILDLWEHKSSLAMNHRPFDELSPVFKALRRLSEPQNPWDFYGTFGGEQKPNSAESQSNSLLRTALDIENTVREVVKEIVIAAAATATAREEEWLQLSDHLDSDGDVRTALKLIHQLQYGLADSDGGVGETAATKAEVRAAMLLRTASAQLNQAADMLERNA